MNKDETFNIKVFRMKAAQEFLAAILSNPKTTYNAGKRKQQVETAIKYADELIEQMTDVRVADINEKQSLLDKELSDTNLSVRATYALRSDNIKTVGDLVKHKLIDIMRLRNVGKKTIREIEDFVESIGLHFGMEKGELLW